MNRFLAFLAGAAGIGLVFLKLLLGKKDAELKLSKTNQKIAEDTNKYYQRKTRADEALEKKQIMEAKEREESFNKDKRDQLENDW